jgi:hypothetical protein
VSDILRTQPCLLRHCIGRLQGMSQEWVGRRLQSQPDVWYFKLVDLRLGFLLADSSSLSEGRTMRCLLWRAGVPSGVPRSEESLSASSSATPRSLELPNPIECPWAYRADHALGVFVSVSFGSEV